MEILLAISLAMLAVCVVAIIRLTSTKATLQERLAASERSLTEANNAQHASREELRNETAALLAPLRQQLADFSHTVSEKYSREASERFALREKLDELRLLNDAVGTEARRLSEALRGNNRVQGEWGELVLQTLLERAGLTEGREFHVQQGAGGLRPDVVVDYPQGGCVVIDSKTSLTAYMNFVEAKSDELRQAAGKAHLASVRAHIDELSRKNYSDLLGRERKLEFVLMFMPNEGAYLAALQLDAALWQYAYDRRVVVISPTHLMAVLKLIEQMWAHDAQNRNALAIAAEAGALYDKFVGLYTDLNTAETRLTQAADSLAEVKKKLADGRGNLLTRVEKLREMGAPTKKRLPN